MSKHFLLGRALAAAAMAATAAGAAAAQPAGLPPDSLSLGDLAAFRAPGAGWRVVGAATGDRARAGAVTTAPGSGVLVNLAPTGQGADLSTAWEHGDIDLELEFMVPAGTDAGVFLQGRYEVQLAAGAPAGRAPNAADAGAIAPRWDATRGVALEGHAPRVAAGRAPGLWQSLRIQFRAPRFDAQGRKVADARFVRVEHDGVVVHEGLRVTGPTRGAPSQDERAAGPLVLQGTGGPVAVRNVRYKRYTGGRVRLSSLRYRAAEGQFADLAAAAAAADAAPPARRGVADGLTSQLAGAGDRYVTTVDGTLHVPAAGRYQLEMHFDWVDDDPQFKGTVVGGGRVSVAGREVLVHPGRLPSAAAPVELTAGEHPITVTFYKNRPWTSRNAFALFAEGPGVERQALHAERAPDVAGAITVAPNGTPSVLRGFVRHGESKRTHAVAVGDPSGVHFSYDLAAGAPLAVWRGPFAETTDMWHDRGNEQLMRPLGSAVALPGGPGLAFLASESAAWPDSASEAAARYEGYALDAAGRPSFLYALRDGARGVAAEDRLRPNEDGTSLRRELKLRAPDGAAGGTGGLFVRLASGARITRQGDGAYLVDGGAAGAGYYVVPDPGAPPAAVRAAAGGQELVAPVRFQRGESTLAYTLVW